MPNCFTFVEAALTKQPEKEFLKVLDFEGLGLLPCPLNEAEVVVMAASVSRFLRGRYDKDTAEAYHAALVVEQHDDGTPKILQERKRGGDNGKDHNDYESQVRFLTYREFENQTPRGHEVRSYRVNPERGR